MRARSRAWRKGAGVPWFSSSSLRFGAIGRDHEVRRLPPARSPGVPGPFEPHHALELAWYAIHPVELLYTLMGPGCESVTRISSATTPTSSWAAGRTAASEPCAPCVLTATTAPWSSAPKRSWRAKPQGRAGDGYRPLVVEIVKFFQTGKPPVSNEETLEIFAFMDAAQRSKEQGGKPMALR